MIVEVQKTAVITMSTEEIECLQDLLELARQRIDIGKDRVINSIGSVLGLMPELHMGDGSERHYHRCVELMTELSQI